MQPKITTLLPTCFQITAMYSVCCYSLLVWRRSSLKKGTPVTYFGPALGPPLGGSGRKTTTLVKRPWVLHPFQVSSKYIKRFWRRSWKCKLSNGRQTTDDGRTPDNAWSQLVTGAFGSCALMKHSKVIFLAIFDIGTSIMQHFGKIAKTPSIWFPLFKVSCIYFIIEEK